MFLDMDGVLVDFDGYFVRNFGVSYNSLHKADAWKHVEAIPNFFRKLPPLPNAKILFNEINKAVGNKAHLEILTAKPRRTGHLVTCAMDKEFWIRRHIDKEIFINCVDGWNNKRHFCQPNDILIDDSQRNCDDWNDAGGLAILYQNDKIESVLKEFHSHWRKS